THAAGSFNSPSIPRLMDYCAASIHAVELTHDAVESARDDCASHARYAEQAYGTNLAVRPSALTPDDTSNFSRVKNLEKIRFAVLRT
ncbi:MAG: hypothetical protein KF747_18175, partial [Nitrospira sp.]|nr:hypothetical protein [Nitrospira sp.]